jgi:hypothetical protein
VVAPVVAEAELADIQVTVVDCAVDKYPVEVLVVGVQLTLQVAVVAVVLEF